MSPSNKPDCDVNITPSFFLIHCFEVLIFFQADPWLQERIVTLVDNTEIPVQLCVFKVYFQFLNHFTLILQDFSHCPF